MEIELSYTEQGHGEPLILLHGNGEHKGYFTHQIEYFSKTRRVIAVDTRGHGESPRGTAPFTIRQFAGDLDAFLASHGIAQADLLGFSDGGNIAMVFALRYPKVKRISALTLRTWTKTVTVFPIFRTLSSLPCR